VEELEESDGDEHGAASATNSGGETVISKRFGTALMMAMTLIVTACSGGGGGSAAPVSSGGGAPSVGPSASGTTSGGTLLIWADDKRAAALKPLAAKFATDNGVSVKVEAISENIVDKFVTASQAGTAPDIVVWAHDVIGKLVRNGAIDPVQLSDTSGFDPLAVKGMTFNGQLYGIPYSVENIALFRNTDLVPDAPATMEDLVKAGKALIASGKTKETLSLQVGQKGDAYHIYPLWVSGGGSFFAATSTGDPDPKNVSVDSAGSLAAGAKLAALGEKGDKVLKRSIDDKNAIPLFFNKQSPFLISGPWAVADIKKAAVNYDISPVPPFAGGQPAGPFIGVNGFYLASKGKNKTLAQEFATNYLTTLDVQVAMFNAEARRPALTAAVDQVKGGDPDLAKFQAASQGGTILPAIPEMGQVWGPFGVAEAALVGGSDVKSTLDSAAKAIRDGIAKQ
jgi:arabinogalactan oligomer/maltooligosaccharide transport system substrate-binding protein